MRAAHVPYRALPQAIGDLLNGIALPTTAAPALLPNISFRLDVDFAPVTKLITSYHVLVVNPSVPAKSMAYPNHTATSA